jgi:hypothetical protein
MNRIKRIKSKYLTSVVYCINIAPLKADKEF